MEPKDCLLAAPRISLSPWVCQPGCIRHFSAAMHSRPTPKRIQVCRLLAGPHHNVWLDREYFRRDEISLVRHHAQERRKSALALLAPARAARVYSACTVQAIISFA